MERFPGREIHVAVEACTGLPVCLPGPGAHRRGGAGGRAGETRALRGRKRRAKPDRADAKWLRQLLCEGGCRRPGARPSTCASGARARGCATRCCPSAPARSSGSARPSITTVSPAPRTICAPSPAASSSPVLRCPSTLTADPGHARDHRHLPACCRTHGAPGTGADADGCRPTTRQPLRHRVLVRPVPPARPPEALQEALPAVRPPPAPPRYVVQPGASPHRARIPTRGTERR